MSLVTRALRSSLARWSVPCFLGLLTLLCGPVRAADTLWHGGIGNWFVGSNWTLRVPTAEDRALIDNGGIANIASGRALASELIVGNSFQGGVNQTFGSNVVAGQIVLGYSGGSTGNYALGLDGRLFASEFHIGLGGAGQFSQTGNSQAEIGVLTVAGDVTGSGFVDFRPLTGQLTVGTENLFSYGANSLFRQTDGLHIVTNLLTLGHRNTGGGTYLLGGVNLATLQAWRESIGYEGTAMFLQTGGIHRVLTDLIIGEFGSGTNEISGGTLAANNLIVQNGLLNIASANTQVYVTNRLVLGESGRIAAVSNSIIWLVRNGFEIRGTHPELSPTLTNLTLIVDNPDIAALECASSSSLGFDNNFTLGTLWLGFFSQGRAVLTNRFSNTSVGDPSQEIFTVGRLLMGQSSMLDLGGRHLFQRDATSLGGELRLSGGRVTVRSNGGVAVAGSLVGPGQIDTGLIVSGKLNLGAVIGLLTISGGLTTANPCVTELKVGGRIPGTEHDQIRTGTGSFLPGGTLRVRLTNGFAPALGDRFTLITYSFLIGRFNTLELPPPANGIAYQLLYTNNAVILEAVPAIAPSILVQPTNRLAVLGGSATFSVVASGSPTPTYQWRLNTANLVGGTNSSLTITNIQTGNLGDYTVVVSNVVGVETSAIARLALTVPPCVAFATPTNLARRRPAEAILVSLSASDVDGHVRQVDLFEGQNLLARLLQPPFNFVWSNSTPGLYPLRARATDEAGATSGLAVITVILSTNENAQLPSFAKQESAWSSFVINSSGRSFAWGDNQQGVLGLGTNATRLLVPAALPPPLKGGVWRRVAAGPSHTLALDSAGRLYGWGPNDLGQLGLGTNSAPYFAPVEIPAPPEVASWQDIAAGGYCSFAVASNGQLYSWGIGNSGRLGNGSFDPVRTYRPTLVVPPPGVANWRAVAAGPAYGFAISGTGQLYAWGADDFGVLGNGTAGSANRPAPVLLAPSVKSISVANGHALALGSDGNVYGWGDNTAGELGTGALGAHQVPQRFPKPPSVCAWQTVTIGNRHALLLGDDGQLYGFGLNQSGQLTGRPDNIGARSEFLAVTPPAGVNHWLAIAAGANHTLGLGSDCNVYTWGNNEFGQLGNGRLTIPTNMVAPALPAPCAAFVTAPPRVRITSPEEGSSVEPFTTTIVLASAADMDGSVARVDFYVDGRWLGADTQIPFTVPWYNTVRGWHTLQAVATDDRGASTVSPAVNVVANFRPNVSFLRPTNDASFVVGELLTLAADAQDSDGEIRRVDYSFNVGNPGGPFQALGGRSISPFAFEWIDPPLAPSSNLFIAAVATDDFGATSARSVINVAVHSRPFVVVTTPTNGSLFQAGGSTFVDATATNLAGAIAQVRFFVSGMPLGTATTEPFRVPWVSLPSGTHELSAVAQSVHGILATSAPVVVSVNAQPAVTLSRTGFNYTEDDGPELLDPAAQVSDADSLNFGGGSLTVEFVKGGVAEDRLGIRNMGADGRISVFKGNRIRYDAVELGTFAGGTGGHSPLVVTFGSKATVEGAQALLRNLYYENVSSQPSMLPRIVRLLLSDGNGGSSQPVFLNIDVRAVNDVPVANPQSATVREDNSIAITLAGSDQDGDALTFSIAAGPVHGTLEGSGATLTYTPALNYYGADSFTFRASDAQTSSAPATVSIQVLPVNDPPVALARVLNLVYLTPNLIEGVILSPNNSNAVVVLDGSQSYDVESDPLQFAWFYDGEPPPFSNGMTTSNLFTVGTHVVTLNVDDGQDAGGTSLTFEVVTPGLAIEDVILWLNESGLPRNQLRPLLATLKAAIASFERGNFTSGANQLTSLQNKVRAQIAPRDPALASALEQAVGFVLDAVGGR